MGSIQTLRGRADCPSVGGGGGGGWGRGKGAGGRDLGEKYDALPYNPAKAARVGLTPWSRQGERFSQFS